MWSRTKTEHKEKNVIPIMDGNTTHSRRKAILFWKRNLKKKSFLMEWANVFFLGIFVTRNLLKMTVHNNSWMNITYRAVVFISRFYSHWEGVLVGMHHYWWLFTIDADDRTTNRGCSSTIEIIVRKFEIIFVDLRDLNQQNSDCVNNVEGRDLINHLITPSKW